MTLGEAYLKDILRPPPAGVMPANPTHPFQSSFYTYATKKLFPKHWYLLAGFTFAVSLYGTLDGLREAGKKKAYDEAVLAGRPACEFPSGMGMGSNCTFLWAADGSEDPDQLSRGQRVQLGCSSLSALGEALPGEALPGEQAL
jgi:hypothetical protein